MKELLEILEELAPGVDFENCQDLVDGHKLNSLAILSLVAELEDEFDVSIPAVDIVPANFNSAKAIWAMVERLQEDD